MSAEIEVTEDPTLAPTESEPASDDGVEIDCSICYETYPKAEIYALATCKHEYCKACISSVAKMQENTGMLVKCPDLNCGKELPPEDLTDFMTSEQLRQYSITFEQTMNSRAAEETKAKYGMIFPSQNLVEKLVNFVQERTLVRSATATDFFHYGCLNENDGGWGCAYRCLQMILSNLLHHNAALVFRADPASISAGYVEKNVPEQWQMIPSLREIQQELANLGRIQQKDVGSTKWIEPPDCASFLRRWKLRADDREYHLIEPETIADLHQRLVEHFNTHQTPVMIDDRIKAYCIVAVKLHASEANTVTHVLRFDPHVFIYPTTPGQWGPVGVQWLPFSNVFSKLSKWLVLFPTRQAE